MQVIRETHKCVKIEFLISFDDTKLEEIKFPHDDLLVIILLIGNSQVKRVLIDDEALVDILFHDAFIKMGYIGSQLHLLLYQFKVLTYLNRRWQG